MSIPVSANFIKAAYSDGNNPIYKVSLGLGNYASPAAYGTTVSSSGDYSSNYPAAGAIDGDRTEINVGPASGADNDVGKSSWRSSGVPDNGDTVTLTITFNQSRTINRVKLYHLSGHGLKTFRLSYWDGANWVGFAATDDIVGVGETSITTTGELDVVDFAEVATTKLRLTVTATSVAMDYANVVELEVYRLVDISDHVKGRTINRARDYKLANPLASTVQIRCLNDDKFFSVNHTPTAAEIALGFVNSELRPGLDIFVWMGFNLDNGTEYVSNFVGTLDKITLSPKSRDAVLEGRDGMKGLVNKQTDYSKLKTTADIADCIQYILNRANVSSFESDLDQTSINIPYFFTENQDHLTTIRDLTEAAGDALFFFDETGKARFKFFTTSINQSHLYTSEIDWEAGTLTAIDTTTTPGDILYSYTEATTWDNSTVGWTINTVSGGTVTHGTEVIPPFDGYLVLSAPVALSAAIAYRSSVQSCGDWTIRLFKNGLASSSVGLAFSTLATANTRWATGYGINISTAAPVANTMTIALVKRNASGTETVINTATTAITPAQKHLVRVRRSQLGYFLVYLDGTLLYSSTDTSYSSFLYFGYETNAYSGSGTAINFYDNYPYIPTTADGNGVWASGTLDCGASIIAFGVASVTDVLNGGLVQIATRSSSNGVSWEAWKNVDGTGQILSTVDRYLQTRITLTLALNGDSPTIQDLTVNWTTGGGSVKYPAGSSYTFAFDSVLLDVQQEISANVGGDTSILNDVTVQAQPLVLSGVDSDTTWQGTVGTPPVAISVTNPLSVTNGDTLTLAPIISGGMDISRMTGGSPAAAVVTFAGGGSGTYAFTSVHPTKPVLVVTVTGTGTITDLRIIGKKYESASYLQAQNVQDVASMAWYGDCQLSISNAWITGTATALSIATQKVANFKDPVSYIPSCEVRPMPSVQLGDRVTVEDENLDLSDDYIVVGYSHEVSVSEGSDADAKTVLTLIQVPAGL